MNKRLLWLLLGGAILVTALRFAVDRPRPQRPRQLPPPAAAPAPRPARMLPKLLRDPFLTPAEEAALTRVPEPPKAVRAALRVEALVVPSDGRRKVAIVNGHAYAEGERIGEETLAVIAADHIELVSPAGMRRTLSFDEGAPVWPVRSEKRAQGR
ncbi:MAG: hypothetical protein E6J78_12225 [Deltaproteobacteria bacterium]|nr:MAG: hypothetical protein E6J78_12225 [Deltaproteobacteria bacterium]